jgi:tRNA A37 threonylcarbamoyladenosine dehydratase
MEELINKIMHNAGISAEQSLKALETVKDYVKEKFPMMADAVDKLFEGEEKKEEEDYL